MRTPESILRDDLPTDGMDAAVREFLAPHPRPLSSGGERGVRPWPAAVGVATVLAVGAVALRLGTTPADASPLARIVAAERDAPRCTSTMRDASGRLYGRAWQEGSKLRLDIDPDAPDGWTNAYDGRRTWFLRRQEGVVVVSNGTIRQIGPTLVQKVADFRGDRVSSHRNADGTLSVVIERAVPYDWADRERHTIVADQEDRPIRIEFSTHKDGRWRLDSRETRDYDAPIPAETFALRVPNGFERYDIDANRAALERGLASGPTRSASGVTVRLLGALQERSGRVTAVYTGGTTPLPDAVALARRDGRRYAGEALVGNPPQLAFARAAVPIGVSRTRALPPPIEVAATPRPYATLAGVPIRIVCFDLPKLLGNPARPLSLTLPIVATGPTRTVRRGAWRVRGTGRGIGEATFENVVPIRSNVAEEIDRLPDAMRTAYAIPLTRAKG